MTPKGVGVIARDEGGAVVAAMSRKLEYPLGALAIEAKALEIGVIFAEEVGSEMSSSKVIHCWSLTLSMVLERLRYRC